MAIELFGSNYLNVRNSYLIPSIKYGITRDRIPYWLFKDVITKNIVSLNKLTGSSIEVEIRRSDFYKSIHCEIELFLNKLTIQYSDFVNSNTGSPCWSLVTLYYFAFFNATCLSRFLNRGYIFLSTEHKKRLEDFSLAVYSEPISIASGNYYFNCKEESSSGNIILTLDFKGDNVHKLNWVLLEATYREFLSSSDKDETLIFSSFLNLFSQFKTEFPSALRNKLNYNGDSSIIDLEGSLNNISLERINRDFVKGLLNLKTEKSNRNQVEALAYISVFLFKFNMQLYGDYKERSGFGKDFMSERAAYLRKHNTPLVI
jgi:hypothetical protein